MHKKEKELYDNSPIFLVDKEIKLFKGKVRFNMCQFVQCVFGNVFLIRINNTFLCILCDLYLFPKFLTINFKNYYDKYE